MERICRDNIVLEQSPVPLRHRALNREGLGVMTLEKLKKHTCFHKLMYRIGENAKKEGTFYDVVIKGYVS